MTSRFSLPLVLLVATLALAVTALPGTGDLLAERRPPVDGPPPGGGGSSGGTGGTGPARGDEGGVPTAGSGDRDKDKKDQDGKDRDDRDTSARDAALGTYSRAVGNVLATRLHWDAAPGAGRGQRPDPSENTDPTGSAAPDSARPDAPGEER